MPHCCAASTLLGCLQPLAPIATSPKPAATLSCSAQVCTLACNLQMGAAQHCFLNYNPDSVLHSELTV